MQYITDALGKMLLKFFFKASPLLVIENHFEQMTGPTSSAAQ